jgi:hypothetical protein
MSRHLTDDELIAQRVLVRNDWDIHFSVPDLFQYFRLTWESWEQLLRDENKN